MGLEPTACQFVLMMPEYKFVNFVYTVNIVQSFRRLGIPIQFNSIYCLPYILYKHITDLETVLANINMHINNNKH